MLFSSMIIPTEVNSHSTFSSSSFKQTEHVFCLRLCRGGAEQCWPRVVVIHGTNFNLTGSVLNCDKLTFSLLIL